MKFTISALSAPVNFGKYRCLRGTIFPLNDH